MMPVHTGLNGSGNDPSVEQALKALEVVLSPVASSTERAQANQYCESVKQDVGQAIHLAKIFIPYTNSYSTAVRQFGLNLLEHVVKGLGTSDMLLEQGFLEQLWSLAFGEAGLNPEAESKTMKEKMAVVLVQAAVRVWPQRWPSLNDLIMNEMGCLLNGPGSARQALNAELAVTMFRMLTEEIHQASDAESGIAWDQTRRQELQEALAVILPGFSEWLLAVLPLAASRSSPNNPTSMSMLSTLIKSFGAVVHWINLKPETTPMVVGTLLNIVQVYEGLREDTLEALLSLSSRPGRTNDEVLFTALFDQEVTRIEQLFGLFVQTSTQGDDEDTQEEAYGHLKHLAEILVNISTMFIAHRKNPSIPGCLDRVLSMLLSLLSLPSLIISSLSMIFWVAAVRGSDKLVKSGQFQSLLPNLFMALLGGMARDRRVERRQRWNRLDFDLDRDFEEVFSANCNRQSCLLEALAGLHPGTVEFLRSAVGSFVADPANGLGLKDSTRTTAKLLAQWSALCSATESISRGSSKAKEDESVCVAMSGLLDGFLSGIVVPSTSHYEVVASWIFAVRGLSIQLGQRLASPSIIPGMLHMVVAYQSPNKVQAEETVVKGRASAFLLKLATVAPKLFLVESNQVLLTNLYSSIKPGEILQQRFFTELFITVSGAIEGQEDLRVDLVDRVTRPYLEDLERMAAWLEPKRLQEAIGGLSLASSGKLDLASAEFRRSVSNILATTFIVSNRLSLQSDLASVPILSEYVRLTLLPRLLPCLLGFLSSVLELAQPAIWLPEHQPIWHELFARRQNDVTNVQAAFDPDPPSYEQSTSDILTLRGWLNTIQVSVMVSIGILTKLPGFYSSLDQLASRYLAGFDPSTASIWSISWVFKHLLHPLLVNAPDANVLSTAGAFTVNLNRLLLTTTLRLQSEWAILSDAAASNKSSLNVHEEVEREAELVMVSQIIINLLYDTLYPSGERDKRVEPCLDLATRSMPGLPVSCKKAIWLVTGDLDRQETLLRFMTVALGWRQTVGYGKLLLLALRWLSTLAMNQQLHEHIFSTGLLPATLSILARPDLADQHSGAAQLTGELYKWSIFLSYDAGVESVFCSLPAITPASLQSLRVALTEPNRTAKQHRESSRVFFKPMQAAMAKEASGKAFVVPRLPEKLVLLKRLKEEPKQEDEVTAEDIDALFG